MYIGGSLVLIVVGAVMRFAVADDLVEGFDMDIAGWIIMAVGFLGLILSLVQWIGIRSDRRAQVGP